VVDRKAAVQKGMVIDGYKDFSQIEGEMLNLG
jgi:hypothetical protein